MRTCFVVSEIIRILEGADSRIGKWEQHYSAKLRRIEARAEREAMRVFTDAAEGIARRTAPQTKRQGIVDAMRYGDVVDSLMADVAPHCLDALGIGVVQSQDVMLERLRDAEPRYTEDMSREEFSELMQRVEGVRLSAEYAKLYGEENRQWFESTGDTLADDIEAIILVGVENGLSVDEIRDLLLEHVADKHRARTIARTEVNRAYNAGALHAMEQAEIEQVEWVQNPDACPVCEINGTEDGGIRDIGEEYPSGDTRPPAHPNCRCAIIAHFDF